MEMIPTPPHHLFSFSESDELDLSIIRETCRSFSSCSLGRNPDLQYKNEFNASYSRRRRSQEHTFEPH